MPVSRRTAEGLGEQLAGAYGDAEVRLLRLIARHLEAGHGSPRWAEAKLAELQTFRRRAAKIVAETTGQAVAGLGEATTTAYLRGAAAGEAELLAAGRNVELPPRQAEHAVEALTRAQANQLEAMGPQIVRQAQDGYRDAVVRASTGTLTGSATRLQDAQVALDDLARRGLSGFTDTAGRRWGLESYVDMATRTTTAQAAVAGHMDRLEQGGMSLFLVSTSSRECERCRPWEGKVLSRGPVDALQLNVVTGQMERVTIDGTVAEATRAGLMHPNCTHNLTGYIHGASRRGDAEGNAAGYAEKQEQRRLERGVREWKRRQAAAMTSEAKRKADAKVREWQTRVRAHTKATGLPRKPHRERFDTEPARTLPASLPTESQAALDVLDDDLLQQQMGDMMAAGDYGPRFEQLAAELDCRDQARGSTPPTLTPEPDPAAEQRALNMMLYGHPDPAARDRERAAERNTPEARAKRRERELRDEYDAWVHTQWLRAEADCRGSMLSREGQAAFDRGEFDVEDLFNRKRRSLNYASDELREWFAQPGNQRQSFPEFRAGIMDDKAAREANQRRRNRGWESEWG